MKVLDVVEAAALAVVAGQAGLEREVSGGYASDLLSCVMAGAKAGNIWVTLQAHANVVAVAELLDLAAVIITEGTRPNEAIVQKAEEKQIPLILSSESTFTVVSHLAGLGIRAQGVEPRTRATGDA